MKIKPILKFRLPLFNVKIKVYVGDTEEIAKSLGFDLLSPSAEYIINDIVYIILPLDYKDYVHKQSIHATFSALTILGIPIDNSTEVLFVYINYYITNYINANL